MRATIQAIASVVIAAAALLIPISAAGQAFQGGLRGAVRDPQGVIPGATVTMVNEETNVARETVTNASGEYSFPAVAPGAYSVRTTVSGYKSFERRGVRIATQEFVTLDIVLDIGTVQETVTVTTEAPLIETSNASTGNVIEQQTLEALPSIGRNVFILGATAPTIVRSGTALSNRMMDQSDAARLSIGGGGVRANNYLLDGFPVTDITNRPITNPSIEAVDDLKVQIHTYDVDMGRTGGGVFNTTVKSGTNAFHGAGYFQNRPTALFSQNFFLALQHVPQQDQSWHDGGGGFGGPIAKNRTFFWVSIEAFKEAVTSNGNFIFPTQAERNGDFSGLTDPAGNRIILYDPLTTRTDPATGQTIRDPFQGNMIPAPRISSVGANLLKYLPLPDLQRDNGTTNTFRQTQATPNGRQPSFKIEHHFNQAIALSAFYLSQTTQSPNANFFTDAPFAAPSQRIDRSTDVLVFNNTLILNASTVLTVRYGWNHFNDNNVLPYPFDAHTLGFNPAFANSIQVQMFPQLSFGGYGSAGYVGKSDINYKSNGVNGTLSKLAGAHSFKFGGDYRRIGVDAWSYGQSAGSFTFLGGFTQGPNPLSPARTSGNPIADVLLGYPTSGAVPVTTPINAFTHYYSGYIQDDYRVSPRVTLTYGVRLEHEDGLREENNHFTVGFDPTVVSPLNAWVSIPGRDAITGGLIFAGVNGAATQQGNPPAVKASPRAGLVLKINDNTVFRSGYGIFYAPWLYPPPGTTSYGQFGYSATTTEQQNTLVPITTIDNPFPSGFTQPSGGSLGLLTGVGGNINFVDPNKGAPRVQQYSADIQRELPGHMNVSIGYVGSRGDHLGYGGSIDTGININQLDPKVLALGSQLVQLVPNPFFGVAAAGALATQRTVQYGQLLRPFPQFLNVLENQTTAARSRYNALVLQLTKQTTGWWGGQMSYTLSRLTDNQFGEFNNYSNHNFNNQLLDNYNPEAEYGPSFLDTPHKISLAPVVQLPFGAGRAYLSQPRWLDYLVGGWSIAAVVTFQSGFPVVIDQIPNNSNLFGSGQRPNIVPGVSPLATNDIIGQLQNSGGTNNQYLNPSAWSLAPAFTFGNAPRTDAGLRTPPRNQLDLAFSKDFPTGRASKAQLRVEVINVTNRPWFAGFNTDFGTTTFGQVTTQINYARFAQIMFRFAW
jgi:hypothetical protein